MEINIHFSFKYPNLNNCYLLYVESKYRNRLD